MKYLLVILLCLSLAGCYKTTSVEDTGAGSGDADVDSDTDTDTDADVDSDTDADTDADADSDTDTDSDSGTEPGQAGTIWVTIPGGAFQMGSTEVESEEEPVHTVNVPTFEMLKSEVTVSQYGECVTVGACSVPDSGEKKDNWGVAGRENHPVNIVDWDQAVAFCTWIGGRLPSEAEWEYAASNGSAENTYPWGDTPTPTCTHAVMNGGCGEYRTWPVCSKTKGNTAHGLCDMAGNVFEWVEDVYHDSYSGAPTDGSAWTSGGSEYRMVRGGSWYFDYPSRMRASYRFKFKPSGREVYFGVRCVRSSL